MSKLVTLGIDFGNTNSIVAECTDNESCQLIEDNTGSIIINNVVSFLDGEYRVGPQAKYAKYRCPETKYDNILRLIEENVTQLQKVDYPVKIDYQNPTTGKVDSRARLPFKLSGYDVEEPLFAEHISTIIFKYLKNVVSLKQLSDNYNLWLSVPFDFTEIQKKRIQESAKIAGFTVQGVIDEPIAAAIAYANENEVKNERVLFIDLGSSSFTTSIVTIEEGKIFSVTASKTDRTFGTNNIDEVIFEKVNEEMIRRNNINLNDEDNKKLKIEALEKCKTIKWYLNNCNSPVYNLIFDNEKSILIGRATLDRIVQQFKDRILNQINDVIDIKYFGKETIDSVVLLCPLLSVRGIISEFFEKEPIIPKEQFGLIAKGAAIYGASMTRDEKKYEIIKTVNRDIGIKITQNLQPKFFPIMKAGTAFPFTSRKFCFRASNNEASIDFCREDPSNPDGFSLIESVKAKDLGASESGIEIDIVIRGENGLTGFALTNESQKFEKYFCEENAPFDQSEYEQIAKDVDELMRPHTLEEEEEESEETPSRSFEKFIKSPKGRKELMGEKKIPAFKVNRVIHKYKNWALNNRDATQKEVDEKMEELKAELEALK